MRSAQNEGVRQAGRAGAEPVAPKEDSDTAATVKDIRWTSLPYPLLYFVHAVKTAERERESNRGKKQRIVFPRRHLTPVEYMNKKLHISI